MTIEDLSNNCFKSLFMNDNSNFCNNYLIGLDDDKLHFHYSRREWTHWKCSLLFENILEAGANVEGTTQRVHIFVLILCWLIIVYSHLFFSFFKFHSRTGSPLHQKNQVKNSLPSQKISTNLDIGTPFPTRPFGKGRMSISKSMQWHIGVALAGLLLFHFQRLILAVIGIWFCPTIIMNNGTFQKTCLLKRSK